MLDPNKQAECDQAIAGLTEMMPPLWRALYLKNMEEGFSEVEAFKLLQTYILSQCTFGIRGSDG